MLLCGFCISRKSGTGKGGQGYPQGAVHMVAARLGCERAMVGTWARSHPDCMDRLRKHYFHLVEGWFLARKAAWSLSRQLIVLSIACSLLRRYACYCVGMAKGWKWTRVQFCSQSLDRNAWRYGVLKACIIMLKVVSSESLLI